jgi:short-subunit dehydrogenase
MQHRPVEWEGRVALVTGASSGIGLAVAKGLVAKGMRVALVARTRARLEEVARDLGTGNAAVHCLDVCDRAALAVLPGQVVERFGRLDVVVHNAGVNHRGAVIERSADDLAAILDANLVAPVLLTRAALPHMRPGGAVVNVASLAGKVPFPHEATYCASKAGLRAFARALGQELHEQGISVSTVCPGPVDTGFLGDAHDVPAIVFSQPMSTSEQVADAVLAAIASGRDVDLPALSGKLATLGYLVPSLLRAIRPLLERRGARNKARFVAQRASRA